MIETSVMYVSAHTSVKVLRIEAIATTSGISTAGSVPKTKSRIRSAPSPPMSASEQDARTAARALGRSPRRVRRGR